MSDNPNRFAVDPRLDARLSEVASGYLKLITAKVGGPLTPFSEPIQDLDLGPVRLIFYMRLMGPGTESMFPFGPGVYLPEIDTFRLIGKHRIDPQAWSRTDIFLTDAIRRMGASWWGIEEAILKAFDETTDLTDGDAPILEPRYGVLEARPRELARAAMFRTDDDRKIVIAHAKSEMQRWDRRYLIPPYQRLTALQYKWLAEDFHFRKPLKELTNYHSYSRTPFTKPVIKAVVQALAKGVNTQKPTGNLPRRESRIVTTLGDFSPNYPNDMRFVAYDFWHLVAAICNHLAPVIFGVPSNAEADLTANAVMKHCGGRKDDFAGLFSVR